MKTHTSITIDGEKLEALRKDGIVLSQWVNEKLDEYYKNRSDLNKIKYPLTASEAEALYLNLKQKEDAIKKQNEDKEIITLQREKRIVAIHEKLNYLSEEKLKESNEIGQRIIMKEQAKLQKELDDLMEEMLKERTRS